jgi:hypothetical protein
MLDATALCEEAKASERKEAYRTLERNPNCRIGVGVRRTPPNATSFFVEVIIYLCPCDGKANIDILEKSLTCLKKLKAIHYSLTCQYDNCISCETTVPSPNLAKEYDKIKTLMKASFG